MNSAESEPSSPPAGVLDKIMVILHAFDVDGRGLGFAELRGRTGLSKATLHRLLKDLVRMGLLDWEKHRYHLGRHLFELGMRASSERDLLEMAIPFLEDLYERTHEIVHLGFREGTEVVYAAKMGSHRQARSPSRLGGRMPLHATAIGKVLLAHAPADVQHKVLAGRLERRTPRTITAPGRLRQQLDAVMKSGVAFEFEESAVGLVCVAAPILDREDQALAAVSVAGPVTRFQPQRHAAGVRAAVARIAVTLARREDHNEPAG